MMTKPIIRILAIVLLMAVAGSSMLWLSRYASSPDFHEHTIAKLEEQKLSAMTLSAVVTVASTAISAIPDDTATPIAEQLSDLSGPLLAIVCVLYAEKFLLTTMGWASTMILLPGACFSGILYLLGGWPTLRRWAFKLAILAVVLVAIVPASVGFTRLVESTFSESVNATFHAAYHLAEETQQLDEDGKNGFLSFFSGLKDNISALVSKAKSMLSIMVDAVAVLIITSCVIPALTAMLFLIVLRVLFHLPIVAMPARPPLAALLTGSGSKHDRR